MNTRVLLTCILKLSLLKLFKQVQSHNQEENVVYPYIVDEENTLLDTDIANFKRHIVPNNHGPGGLIYLRLDELVFKLSLNERFIDQNAIIQRRRGENLAKAYIKAVKSDAKNGSCSHFNGAIQGVSSSLAAITLCSNGMRGFYNYEDELVVIQPLRREIDGRIAHSITKTNRGMSKSETNVLERRRRSMSKERNVETLLVIDRQIAKKFENDDLEHYLLTIMNMVAALYTEPSIGNLINIVLVRIVVLEDDPFEIVTNASATLESFCEYQNKINFPSSHPNHHDLAVFITKTDICANSDTPCDTLGLARMGGVCDPLRSCSINEDSGLTLAFTIAHEIGHNFNADHDTAENGCTSQEDEFIMNTHLSSSKKHFIWSECSRKAITKYLDTENMTCLDNKPKVQLIRQNEPPLPGLFYDLDHQCRLAYGQNATYCNLDIGSDKEDCSTLWCRVGEQQTCSTKTERAAEGTLCGDRKNFWCLDGKCVRIDEMEKPIDGEWGQWSHWGECSRECDTGVQYMERKCENPPPSRGGRYCLGERKRYRLCNRHKCNSTNGDFERQNKQCARKNKIILDGNGNPTFDYEWEYYYFKSNEPCKMTCKPKGYNYFRIFTENFEDGTPCGPFTDDICIDGVCRVVGCDGILDSTVKEDECGVCGGNNSTCSTVEGAFTTTSENFGYMEVLILPIGARSIKITEKPAIDGTNYLAIKDKDDVYYLNGDYKIVADNDFKIKDMVMKYEANNNDEEEVISSKGPITEEVSIMLLYLGRDSNITYEYKVPIANLMSNGSLSMRINYMWSYDTEWTVCDKICGKGYRRLKPKCFDNNKQIVNESSCDALMKPDDLSEPCNVFECDAEWLTGAWQQCSAECEPGSVGFKKRSVLCVKKRPNRLNDEYEIISVPEFECSNKTRPSQIEECSPSDLPGCELEKPDEFSPIGFWITEEWTRTCDQDLCSIETRVVKCSDPNAICDPHRIPVSQRRCKLPENVKCGRWVPGPWSECSMSCTSNIGIRTRSVQCVGGQICSKFARPHSTETCVSSAPCLPPAEPKEPDGDDIFADIELTVNKALLPSWTLSNENTAADETSSSTAETTTEIPSDFFAEIFVKIVKQLESPSTEATTVTTTAVSNLTTKNSTLVHAEHQNELRNMSQSNTFKAASVAHKFKNESKPHLFEKTQQSGLNSSASATRNTTILSTRETSQTTRSPTSQKTSTKETFKSTIGRSKETTSLKPTTTSKKNKTTKKTTTTKKSTTAKPKAKSTTNKRKQIRDIVIDLNDEAISSMISESENGTLSESYLINLLKMRMKGQGFVQPAETTTSLINSTTPAQKTTFDVDWLISRMKNQKLEYEWETGVFGSCSRPCGGGFRTRKVLCRSTTTNADAPDMKCLKARPVAFEQCNKQKCDEWNVTEWSNCSIHCGDGFQHRKVFCENSPERVCDPYHIPTTTKPCFEKPCLEWVSEEWSNCSVSCGLGLKVRRVYCHSHITKAPSEGCNRHMKPNIIESCMINEICTTTTTTESPECKDSFSKSLCRKVFYSNRCSEYYLSVKCCQTCSKQIQKFKNGLL